jgi:hypothetical protein
VSDCGLQLPGGGSCTASVSFIPTTAGNVLTGALLVESTAPSGPHEVPLEGRGVLLDLVAQPANLDFGAVAAGEEAELELVATNRGTDFLELGAAAVAGTDAGQFRVQKDECSGRRLEAGQGCQLVVVFHPDKPAGPRSAALWLPSRAPESPENVPLAGYSNARAGQLIFSDGFESGDLSAWSQVQPAPEARLAFPRGGELATAAAARLEARAPGRAWQRVLVVNDGAEPLALAALRLVAPAAFRLAADECGERTLEPGAACRVLVAFGAEQAGAWSAELLVPALDGRAARLAIHGTARPGEERR